MNDAFYYGAIGAQFPPFGHLELGGQLGETMIETFQRFWLDQLRPADQGRVIRDFVEIHPAELA